MSKSKRAWELVRRSLAILKKNPKLLIFPSGSFLMFSLIILFILTPLSLKETGYSLLNIEHWKSAASSWVSWNSQTGHLEATPAGYGLIIILYLLVMFVANFLNVAFYNEIFNALNDQPVSVRGGLKFALSKIRSILAWSLLTGIVGLMLKALEQRVGAVSRVIVRIIGLGWQVSSMFVIPVIVRESEGANPFHLLKTSASTLKRTWGESLIGYLGPKVIAVALPWITMPFVIIAAGVSIQFFNGMLVPFIFLGWFALLMCVGYVLSVLGQIFLGALYIYATEGVIPGPYDEAMMESAWKIKNGRTRGNLT